MIVSVRDGLNVKIKVNKPRDTVPNVEAVCWR